jgi:iron complex transport system ATP-binding protein
MYQASAISFRVRDRFLLQNVNLTVTPGSFVAVVGQNGAGKSSLLKIMANEQTNYQGEVILNGRPIKSYKAKELSQVRAVLPQNTNVQFAFSVGQVVMLGRHSHMSTRKENNLVVDEVMAEAGVDSLRDRSYMTLSGGEKQRVQLARVLAQVWSESLMERIASSEIYLVR